MGLKGILQKAMNRYGSEDKIRPKWDWKGDLLINKRWGSEKIKSDQNGIERITT